MLADGCEQWKEVLEHGKTEKVSKKTIYERESEGRRPLGTGESGHECLSQKDNNVLIGIMKWLHTKHANMVASSFSN